MTQRRAAIDIGTVSTRLLVADVADESVAEVVRHTCITHLGQDLATTGRLASDGVVRVLEVVKGFVEECRELRVGSYAVAATSAVRDASDGAAFVERLAALGIEPQVIPGSREAFLSFRGATLGRDLTSVLVCDLGGGSTELIAGSSHPAASIAPAGTAPAGTAPAVEIEASRSIDCGSRRVTDMFLKGDPPAQDELERAGAWIAEQFRPYFDALRERPRCAMALAGTATTLSAIRLGLVEYDPARVHGSCLTGADLAMLRDDLAALPLARRRQVPGLDPARAGVIVAGALILETIVAMSGLDSVEVSEHDILYGLVLEGV